MPQARGYAAENAKAKLKPMTFERREVGPKDVGIEVLFCGVCHSDIHQVKDEWDNTVYPCMPGHEVVGRVTEVGADAGGFKEGDMVGVGCMVDSCRECEPCRSGEENYCEGPNSWLATYNGPMIPASKSPDGGNIYGQDNTFGGYSDRIVVDRDFVLKLPEGLDPAAAAPILCAGVTTYSPLKRAGVKAGDKVGVLGVGGLGHMAVKLAKAMGAQVTAFTSNKDKVEALQSIGADKVVLTNDAPTMAELERSFDFILSTIPQGHDPNPFIELLKRDSSLVVVGALEPLAGVDNMAAAQARRSVSGSLIGSVAETAEVLQFCADHGIAPEIQVIPIDGVNDAFDAVERGEVRFRYVIDMASLKNAA